MRRKDWAGTIFVACFVTAAGLLHNHTIALVMLLAAAVASAAVIVWDTRRKHHKRASGKLRVLTPPRVRVPRSIPVGTPRTFADRMRPRREAELRQRHAEEQKARDSDNGL